MLYLWIFGDNVEAAMGRTRFVLFYMICGTAAAMAQAALDPSSTIPMIGASGGIAGILGAKQTSNIIPLCHPLGIDHIDLTFNVNYEMQAIEIEAKCSFNGKTGIEMEALTAVSIAALTIYDMCKSVDKNMSIGDIRLTHKTGGTSGVFNAK